MSSVRNECQIRRGLIQQFITLYSLANRKQRFYVGGHPLSTSAPRWEGGQKIGQFCGQTVRPGSVDEGGGGCRSKNPENFEDVLYGWPLHMTRLTNQSGPNTTVEHRCRYLLGCAAACREIFCVFTLITCFMTQPAGQCTYWLKAEYEYGLLTVQL